MTKGITYECGLTFNLFDSDFWEKKVDNRKVTNYICKTIETYVELLIWPKIVGWLRKLWF